MHALTKRLLVHMVELKPHHNFITVVENPQFAGNGAGSVGVIPGNHHWADTSAFTALDRLPGLGPGRILQTDQAQQRQLLFDVIVTGCCLCRRTEILHAPLGKGEYAQRLVCHERAGLSHSGAVDLGQLLDASLSADVGATLENHLWRSLSKGPWLP